MTSQNRLLAAQKSVEIVPHISQLWNGSINRAINFHDQMIELNQLSNLHLHENHWEFSIIFRRNIEASRFLSRGPSNSCPTIDKNQKKKKLYKKKKYQSIKT